MVTSDFFSGFRYRVPGASGGVHFVNESITRHRNVGYIIVAVGDTAPDS